MRPLLEIHKSEPVSRIAVVIPSYNHAHYIVAALDSALNQTLPPVRVIVVDDGSTDASPDVLRAYVAAARERQGLVTLLFQENAGAHAAINRGIEAAGNADYIAILNSDDLFEPTRFEKCAGYLATHPECQVVCSSLRLIDADGAFLPEDLPKARRHRSLWAKPERNLAEWLGIANFTKTTSNFFVRTAYAKANEMRGYRYAHDYFFAVRAAVEGQLGVIPEPLLRYRTHATNTIKKDGAAKVAREVVEVNLHLLQELAPRLLESPSVRAAYTAYFRELIKNHADFRAEVFFALAAQFLRVDKAMSSAHFPELDAPPSKTATSPSENSALEQIQAECARSRWILFGISLGLAPNIFATTGSVGIRALGERLKRSPWVRLGVRLGFVKKFL